MITSCLFQLILQPLAPFPAFRSMDPITPEALPYSGTCVPYAQATTLQLSRALTYVVETLARHFPTFDFSTWSNALLRFQPDLWVAGDQVYLEDEDLAQLTQRLADSPQFVPLDPPIYDHQTGYLARLLVKHQDAALHALLEIEAAPLAYGGSVLALILDLAAGNGIAQRIYSLTLPGPELGRRGRPDPAAARQAAGSRIDAVRIARGSLV